VNGLKPLKQISMLLMLSLCFFFSATSHSAAAISDDKEILYFFSYHCGECYKQQPYVSILNLALKSHDVDITPIPLLNNQNWRSSARLYYLLSLSKEHYALSSLAREKAGFALILERPNIDYNAQIEYMNLFKDFGMKFSILDFSNWWKNSEILLSDTELLISQFEDELGYELTPGMLRVSRGQDSHWFDFKEQENKLLLPDVIEVFNESN
jgi:hypothetical protein